MLKKGCAFVLLVAAWLPPVTAGSEEPPGRRFQRAVDLIETDGDCAGGLMLLRDVARARDRSVAARAFLYIGYCQEKRRTGEASGTYRSILAEFPEQREAVYEARRRLSLLGHAAASNGVATSVQSTWIPTAVARISVGGIPQRVAITPGGDEVYVTSLESNTVSVFETTTYKVTSTIAVHGQPGPIVVAQDGLHVYVGHGDGGITVIDARTKFARWVDVGNGPVRDLALTRDGRSLYIAAEHSGLRRLKLATPRRRFRPQDVRWVWR